MSLVYVQRQSFFSSCFLIIYRLFASMDTSMDTSWMQEEEKFMQLDCTASPCEPLKQICLEFLYVNTKNEYVHQETVSHSLEGNVFTKENIQSLVETYRSTRQTETSSYFLKDLLFFHVPIESHLIPAFVKKDIFEKTFLSRHSILEDLVIPPAVFVFHSSSTLFFILYEQKKVVTNSRSSKSTLKIKPPHSSGDRKKHRITKKVRFSCE